MRVLSPFNSSVEAKIISKISAEEIVNGYSKTYNIDVSENFKGVKDVYICQCPLTDMGFYYPFSLDGDSDFYKQLSLNNWYYSENRWEHNEIINSIQEGASVLEIGSGDAVFLSKLISKKKVSYTGLELNLRAIEKAKLRGVNLINETLNAHILNNNGIGKYDIVCSFQVLEHISAINSILVDSLKALKIGGQLIIAVPNNDASFMKRNVHPSKYLNMPPHHVNLFNERSLKKLAELFNLKLTKVIKEPLQQNHLEVILYNKLAKLFFNNAFFVKAIWRIKLHTLLLPVFKILNKEKTGHTIIAIYKKEE